MENATPAVDTAGLTQAGRAAARRRLLLGGFALLGFGAAGPLVPVLPAAARDPGFLIVDGWVLPARYFRD